MDSPSSPFQRFLLEASVHLEEVGDLDKALKRALKLVREAFDADEACLAVLPPGQRWASGYASLPTGATWKNIPFADFLAGKRPRLTSRLLLARVERRGRPWGVLALRNRSRDFERPAVRDMTRLGARLSRMVERLDRLRLVEVRERIDRKMMEQLRPLDLFYQILHGLRSLTRYDHSAAVWIHDEASEGLDLVAEQISWRKGASRRIGRRLPLDDAQQLQLLRGEVLGFDRVGGRWQEWRGRGAGTQLVERVLEPAAEERTPLSVLVAPLISREELLGVLVVAACHPTSLGPYEAQLVQRLGPVAAVAIRNMGRTTSLESGMLEAEQKSALATLARGVSHDVNNAFGAVLPLVQQLGEDARSGAIDARVFGRDLEQIEASLQVCRRIFSGMLSFARSEGRTVGEGDLERAVEGVRAVLEESMRRGGVELTVEVEPALPLVRGTQTDLEQLVLNLATNARDAMPGGGHLSIRAARVDQAVEVLIRDSGCGIAERDLARVGEPFFTTKSRGSGLGLSICRAILWRMHGEMKIESETGQGTRIRLVLPLAGTPRRSGADTGAELELETAE